MTITVERAGLLTTIQDLGRTGVGGLGVSPSGAFDRAALRQGNSLVGNDFGSAALECLRGGVRLRADADHVVAVTGAASTLRLDGRAVEHGRALHLPARSALDVAMTRYGLRTYISVSGGIDVPSVLGSRSTDTLAGLGPAPVTDGTSLPIGSPGTAIVETDVPWTPRLGETTVDVVLGPRHDWFTEAAVNRLLSEPWEVTARSNRIGLRLSGPQLERAVTAELPSEPCVRGSIQVAADGQPIVFGPDHPVTGGYPVIAVVRDSHTDRLAQLTPGDTLRFTRTPKF